MELTEKVPFIQSFRLDVIMPMAYALSILKDSSINTNWKYKKKIYIIKIVVLNMMW